MTIENKETITKCFCLQHSCEQTVGKIEGVLTLSSTKRYQFDKEDGVIVNGGIVSGDILNCRALKKYDFYNTIGDLKKAENENSKKKSKKKDNKKIN